MRKLMISLAGFRMQAEVLAYFSVTMGGMTQRCGSNLVVVWRRESRLGHHQQSCPLGKITEKVSDANLPYRESGSLNAGRLTGLGELQTNSLSRLRSIYGRSDSC